MRLVRHLEGKWPAQRFVDVDIDVIDTYVRRGNSALLCEIDRYFASFWSCLVLFGAQNWVQEP